MATLRLKATYEILENTNETRWTVSFRSIQVERREERAGFRKRRFRKGPRWLMTFQGDDGGSCERAERRRDFKERVRDASREAVVGDVIFSYQTTGHLNTQLLQCAAVYD